MEEDDDTSFAGSGGCVAEILPGKYGFSNSAAGAPRPPPQPKPAQCTLLPEDTVGARDLSVGGIHGASPFAPRVKAAAQLLAVITQP